MSTVEVRLYATLRKFHPNPDGGDAFTIELEDKSRLADLVDKLKIPKEQVGVVMVNGKWEKEDYLLQEGDRVGLFPLIGGG